MTGLSSLIAPRLHGDKTMQTSSIKLNRKMNWLVSVPFFVMHTLPFAAYWTGTRPIDWIAGIALFWVRMFFITAGYHRYFAHRTFKMGRLTQFVFAFMAQSSAQKGVLWWSGHHRHHHVYSDEPQDLHSPGAGFWWSHCTWFLSYAHEETPEHLIKDFRRFPELRWMNNWHYGPPVILGVAVFLTLGWSGLWIAFFLSTVLLFHATFTINSLAHVFGSQRYDTGDDSRNNLWLALLTLGEGWHNNHHQTPNSCRQGHRWWEIDVCYYILRGLQVLGIVWGIKEASPRKLSA
jgi:stearoyl-CoA desaturase (delta-9 desaturase)